MTSGPPTEPRAVEEGDVGTVRCYVLRPHLAAGEEEVSRCKSLGATAELVVVDPPILEHVLLLLADEPHPVAVDLTSGPPLLTHACQFGAQLLGIRHFVRNPFGSTLELPRPPVRPPPSLWHVILRSLASSSPPRTTAELAAATAVSESTVRYHLLGRGEYHGMNACGLVTVHRNTVQLQALGRAALKAGILTRRPRHGDERPPEEVSAEAAQIGS